MANANDLRAALEHLPPVGTLDGKTDAATPVVKLFTPDAGASWFITEYNPDETGMAFGLCDLGLGFPELGYIAISELGAIGDWRPQSQMVYSTRATQPAHRSTRRHHPTTRIARRLTPATSNPPISAHMR